MLPLIYIYIIVLSNFNLSIQMLLNSYIKVHILTEICIDIKQ